MSKDGARPPDSTDLLAGLAARQKQWTTEREGTESGEWRIFLSLIKFNPYKQSYSYFTDEEAAS